MEMMTNKICFKIYYAAFLAMDLKINCLLTKKCWVCSSFTTKRGRWGQILCAWAEKKMCRGVQ